MARKVSRGAGPSTADDHDDQDGGKLPLGRRALLSRGGIVAAGVVGAGAVATAVAGPASAQATTAVDMNTANDAGTSGTPTELDADNDTTPAFILTNTGVDATNEGSGPNLRLTPSAATGQEPTASTVGGDLTATFGGELWFTHNFSVTATPDIVSAPVHTEATANVYAQLVAPVRILDTRSASGRANIVNPSGNLDSGGRLKTGKTIYINLDSQVYFAEAVFANITVTKMAGGGYLTVWSGATATPNASTINYPATGSLANFLASGIAEYSSTVLNVIAIYCAQTTHVILDLAGFTMPGFEYAKYEAATTNGAQSARLKRAQAAMRNAARA
jgi:hypothetical protein